MAKRKKKFDKKVLAFGLVVLGLLTALMMLLPALKVDGSETVIKGYEAAFGKESFRYGSISGGIKFDILVTLGFVLPLIGGLVAYYVKKGELIALLLFVAAVVLLIMVPDQTQVTYTFGNAVIHTDIDWVMGIGLILPIVFSILGTLLSLYMVIKSLKK